MIARGIAEAAVIDAIAACDPSKLVARAVAQPAIVQRLAVRTVIGLAVGKAAIAMARGAGPVTRGLVVSTAHETPDLPSGWRYVRGSHPEPDAASEAAGTEALSLIRSAAPADIVLALISGGSSALLELPVPGVSIDELASRVRARMRAGDSIHELNRLRTTLSAIKGGQLAAVSRASVISLVISDVVGDELAVIGSGPTIAHRASDHAELIAPMSSFAEAVVDALGQRGIPARRIEAPFVEDVKEVAVQLASSSDVVVGWGEPTVTLGASSGEGGRARQLALELARRLRGTDRSALVAGSDGVDGPVAMSGAAIAGAFVDGTTWDAIAAAGIDPEAALARADAGPALAAVGAQLITGATGINHADVMIVG
ncbi:MAG: DUF4147 domain-containing protein [Kofleriaceae bacterium]